MSDERPCAEYADDWSAYLDAELPGEREALLRAHLEGCDLCSGRVEALRSADAALLDEVSLPEPSAELRERLQTRIDADSVASLEEARARRRRIGPLAGLLAAAAALALYLAIAGETPLAPSGTEPEPAVARSEPESVRERPTPETVSPETDFAHETAPETGDLPEVVMPAPEVLAADETPAPEATQTLLDAASDEDLALALELDTIEDLDVIENLELLEALLVLEGETG
jgi:hypothetical protein